jgi:hypothetical protein
MTLELADRRAAALSDVQAIQPGQAIRDKEGE